MKKFLYGIDFGTTNSALSIFDEEKGEIVDSIILPSLIYFPEGRGEDCVIGNEAISAYLDDGMRGRFIKSVKQILSRSSFTETLIGKKRYNAPALVALILKELKSRADKITGQDCLKAVIGRPVFFDDDNMHKDSLAQSRLEKAADIAGFEQVRFQFEPIGAAFAYEKTLLQKKTVLVADLGGGTTDFTCLVLDPENAGKQNRKDKFLGTGGIYIGGDSFDSAFMWEKGTPYFGKNTRYKMAPGKYLTVPKSLFSNICSWDKMNFFNGARIRREIEDYYYFSDNDPKFKNLITLVDENLGYSVFHAIEQTKIALSSLHTSSFTYSKSNIEINELITVEEYESIINSDVTRISNYLDQFLATNGIDAKDIDCLFLTGGTSLVPAIRNLFKSKFPDIPLNSGDNFISVANGLAYSGYLFNNQGDMS
ncbi:Hsp70 family protein [Arcticibacter tournemirensis]